MSAVLSRLERLYANTDDPWNFDGSAYEQEKFRQTAAALSRSAYTTALELGCGNGALAAHLSPRCRCYVGLDAVERPLKAARARLPDATFVKGIYPCPLPAGDFDLIVLSEFLYFLTAAEIEKLALDIASGPSRAELIIVSYLGDTAQDLQGLRSLRIFQAAMRDGYCFTEIRETENYRIDRGVAREQAT